MAKFGKPPETKKKKGRFGAPPVIEEASTTLEAPEHAPTQTTRARKARNKTGRTIPFGTKVSAKFNKDFREVAFRSGLKNAELLEKMLEMYKKIKR